MIMKQLLLLAGLMLALFVSGCQKSAPDTGVKIPPAVSDEQAASQNITPKTVQANVFLTLAYDEFDQPPKAQDLTILLNGDLVTDGLKDGTLSLSLAPGTYDLQVKSADPRSAARKSFTVAQGQKLETSFVLKSEALSLLGDYEIKMIGVDDNGSIDASAPFAIGVFDKNADLLPFDNLSMVMITPIETGSFTVDVGGSRTGRGTFLQNKLTLDGTMASLPEAEFKNLFQTLGAGQFEIEASLYDSVNDKIYEQVFFIEIGL